MITSPVSFKLVNLNQYHLNLIVICWEFRHQTCERRQLRKIPMFQLIAWSGIFVEIRKSAKTDFRQNFLANKLIEI